MSRGIASHPTRLASPSHRITPKRQSSAIFAPVSGAFCVVFGPRPPENPGKTAEKNPLKSRGGLGLCSYPQAPPGCHSTLRLKITTFLSARSVRTRCFPIRGRRREGGRGVVWCCHLGADRLPPWPLLPLAVGGSLRGCGVPLPCLWLCRVHSCQVIKILKSPAFPGALRSAICGGL